MYEHAQGPGAQSVVLRFDFSIRRSLLRSAPFPRILCLFLLVYVLAADLTPLWLQDGNYAQVLPCAGLRTTENQTLCGRADNVFTMETATVLGTFMRLPTIHDECQ